MDQIGNGGLIRTIMIVLITSLITYIIGFGIYTIQKLSTIDDKASIVKERTTVLEYRMDGLDRAMRDRTEDRYTSKDAVRDRMEYEKRFQALEKRK